MSHFRIDDKFWSNKKNVRLRNTLDPRTYMAVRYVWEEMGIYCAGNYTDGKINIRTLAQLLVVNMARTRKLVSYLIDGGLVIDAGGGDLVMHDFLVHNISDAQHQAALKGGRQRKRESDSRRRQAQLVPEVNTEAITSVTLPCKISPAGSQQNQEVIKKVTALRTALPDPDPIAAPSAAALSKSKQTEIISTSTTATAATEQGPSGRLMATVAQVDTPEGWEMFVANVLGLRRMADRYRPLLKTLLPLGADELRDAWRATLEVGGRPSAAMVLRKIEIARNTPAATPLRGIHPAKRVGGSELSYKSRIAERGFEMLVQEMGKKGKIG